MRFLKQYLTYRKLKSYAFSKSDSDNPKWGISFWCHGSYSYHTPWFELNIQYHR